MSISRAWTRDPAVANSIPMLRRNERGTRRKTWFPATKENGGESRASDVLAMPFDDSIAFFDPFCHELSIPLGVAADLIAKEGS